MASTKRPTKKPPVKAGNSRQESEHKRRLFVEAYCSNGGNGKQAAITAGYAPKSAEVKASQLLRCDKVAAEIAERRKQALVVAEQETGVSVNRTLKELGRIAYFDPRKMFDESGNLKKVSDLDDDTAAALASFEVTEEFAGKGEERQHIGYTKKVKVFDKNAAIEKAMRHLGLFEIDNSQQQARTVNVGALTVSLDFDKVRGGRVIRQA